MTSSTQYGIWFSKASQLVIEFQRLDIGCVNERKMDDDAGDIYPRVYRAIGPTRQSMMMNRNHTREVI